jgi:hypothetical protein
MQAAKMPGLAEEPQGEDTKWRKTYGKIPPCLNTLHDGAAAVFRRSVGFLLNPEAQSLIAAITGGIGHLYTLFPAGIPQSADWVSDKSSPTWLRRGHRGERGRLARGEVPSLNEARERRRHHNTQSAGKPRTGGRTPGD